MEVANQLLDWFNEPSARDRVTRVVLLWVNNHFTDFEMDPVMMDFVEKFEACLEENKMGGQLRLLNIACAAKARTRCVTLARPSRDQVLHFSILGGYERGFGIFISKVCAVIPRGGGKPVFRLCVIPCCCRGVLICISRFSGGQKI